MDAKLQSLRTELGSLAESANCVSTRQFLNHWAASDRPCIALLELGGDSGAAGRELQRQTGGNWTAVHSDSDGANGWLADRLVVTFPAGEVPSALDLNTLASCAFSRPASTVVLALTGAERIDSTEDLRLVEALATRWLLPPLTTGPSNQPLRQRGGFLWSQAAATDAGLSERLMHDRAALLQCLREPLTPQVESELNLSRLRFACDLAESELASCAPNAGHTRNLVCDAQTDLEQLRERVLKRLRSDADSLEMSIRVASEALEQDLLAGLPEFINNNPQLLQDPALVDGAFIGYCESVIRRWEAQPRNAARQWGRSIEELTTEIRSSTVWQRISQPAQPFSQELIGILERSRLEFVVPPVSPESRSTDQVNASDGVVTTFVATLLGAGVGMLSGLGPPAIAAGGGLGAVCGVLFRRHNLQQERKVSLEQAARQEVVRVARAARAALTQVVYDHTQHLRRGLSEVFQRSQLALDQTLSAALQGDSQALNTRDEVARLRQRIDDSTAQS